MNFVIGTDCYASQPINTTEWIQSAGTPSNEENYQHILNISYKFRLMCVLGVTIWSQIAFLGLTQICKPLRLLTKIILVYTVACYIVWMIGFGIWMNEESTQTCSPPLDTTSVYGRAKVPFFNNKDLSDIQQWAV